MYRYRVTVAVLTPDIVTLRTLTNIQAQYILSELMRMHCFHDHVLLGRVT